MNRRCPTRRLAGLRTVFTAALVLSLLVIAASSCSQEAAGTLGATGKWQHVVSRGFGNAGNSYLLDEVRYMGALYVGTNANPSTKLWSGSAKSGGDVWRTRNGVTWERVGKPGFGNPHNRRVKGLVVFQKRLYALTGNDDQGMEVWVSTGGAFHVVARGGFGDRANQDPLAWVFDGKLIVVTSNQHGPQIWVSDDGAHFVRASAPGLAASGNTGPEGVDGESHQGVVFGGRLYVGMTNPRAGGELWRTADGVRWSRVARGGLGRAANISLGPQIVFKGHIYVEALHRVSTSRFGGIDVFRSADGKRFERVVHDGFGASPDERVGGTLSVFQNRLYLSLSNMDPRLLMPGRPGERFEPKGFEVWRSADGKSWHQTIRNGLGDHARFAAFVGRLAGTACLFAVDYRHGNSLWSSTAGRKWTVVWHESGHPFSEGGGWFVYDGHVYVQTNDLARGIDIWRSTEPVSG